jgi:hypothetical protein
MFRSEHAMIMSKDGSHIYCNKEKLTLSYKPPFLECYYAANSVAYSLSLEGDRVPILTW